ncbi:hypothetical protein CH29_gp65 [Achromobacter phage JWAlpha]|uniref:HNH nuclease domain-containing protein n=1 Tax=Achromobacter phage JWAlpha TaxID=1416009 RepID=V9VHP8_9CAUD|nr:hypothetical protein CH29_gp65 [Achromobacter phage JWAlpha]AHC94018.1 hypothetical protein JJJB_0065 [Achromobacter phage JWAlpha]
MQITDQDVLAALDYNPITGVFTWKVKRNNQTLPGQQAGSVNNEGYVTIPVMGVYYAAHRLAWLVSYGCWPVNQIDHVNRIRTDNRLCNLRDVTQTVNTRSRSMSKANSTGVTGVYKTRAGNWIARICVDRKQINLGTFASIEEATAARQQAIAAHAFNPTHGL